MRLGLDRLVPPMPSWLTGVHPVHKIGASHVRVLIAGRHIHIIMLSTMLYFTECAHTPTQKVKR